MHTSDCSDNAGGCGAFGIILFPGGGKERMAQMPRSSIFRTGKEERIMSGPSTKKNVTDIHKVRRRLGRSLLCRSQEEKPALIFSALEESFLPKPGQGLYGASFTKKEITHTVICA